MYRRFPPPLLSPLCHSVSLTLYPKRQSGIGINPEVVIFMITSCLCVWFLCVCVLCVSMHSLYALLTHHLAYRSPQSRCVVGLGA